MAVAKTVINHIGTEFPIKNLWLLMKATGQNQAEGDRYLEDLRAFETKEKSFRQDLQIKLQEISSSDPQSSYLKRLKAAHLEAEFYKPYVGLTYDAELCYKKAVIESEEIPKIIKEIERLDTALAKDQTLLDQVKPEEEAGLREELKTKNGLLEEEISQEKSHLKALLKDGQLSRKAYFNQTAKLKRSLKHRKQANEQQIPSVFLKQEMQSLKYQRRQNPKQIESYIRSEINDLEQNIPVETSQQFAWKSIVSAPFPGVGQFLNGQPIKGLLMLVLTALIYLVFIPYTLGYGNYQGNGVAGLVTLAVGGARLDRSINFMIEGVIAIFFLIFTLVILYLSFKDVRRVEKGNILGLRPNSWSVTSKKILEEGFPYTVNIPSLIMITFVVLVPIVTTLLLSFAGQDPQNQSKFDWVGFQNYLSLLQGRGVAGALFGRIFLWTLIWTIGGTTLSILVGFFLAFLVNNERIRFKSFFRTIYILPWAIPGFISILLFSIYFSPNSYFTNILNAITGQSILVKDSTFWTRIVLIIMKTWLGSSYVFLLSLGVLQSIPHDLYEAADIDGATGWQKLSKITLPLVLFQTAPLLVGQYTFNFNDFTAIFLFNGGGPFNASLYGNLAGSSDILISYIYKLTLNNNYQSLGAAIAILISLGLMVFAFIGYSRSKAFREIK